MDPLRYRGGSVKYGWKLEGRYLVPHPHEQAGLAMAREMRDTVLGSSRMSEVSKE